MCLCVCKMRLKHTEQCFQLILLPDFYIEHLVLLKCLSNVNLLMINY